MIFRLIIYETNTLVLALVNFNFLNFCYVVMHNLAYSNIFSGKEQVEVVGDAQV